MTGVSVFLDSTSFNLQPRDSDWTYTVKKMPRIADWEPDIRFVLQDSFALAMKANIKKLRGAIGRRVGLPISRQNLNVDCLDAGALTRSGCDVIFSHRGLPINCGDVPIIWMNAIVDPVMTRSYFGLKQADLDEEIEVKGQLFRRASVVQVCTQAEAARHAQIFPDIADRFVPVPYFTPHLEAAPECILEKHCNPTIVKMLFVGNDARIKGLQETLEAYTSLPGTIRKRTSFVIISHFDRSKIKIPNDPQITVYHGLPQAAVIEHMRAAHILVNVAHCESYGIIFPEAMSQGTLCLGPDWEVQRELFDEGRAGMNLRCEHDLLRTALLRVIEDVEYRRTLAYAGWRRFNERYAPVVVARRYAELFLAVAAGAYN